MATSNKTVPIVLIGVAAMAVVAYFGMNYPAGDEVTGTVAPAERYRAEQISEDDIALGDQAVQDFMQSDLFAKLTTDEALRDAFANDAVRDALANESVRDAFANEYMRDAFANESVRDAFANESVRDAFANESVRDAFANESVRDAFANEAVRDAFANAAIRDAISAEAVREMARDRQR